LDQLIGIHLRFRRIEKVQELLEQYRAHQDTIQYVIGNIHYFKNRYQADSAQGNTSATLHNFRKWVELKDSMNRLISSEDLLRKQSAFDLIQRDTQLKILQERQYYQRNLFISIIFFLGISAFGLVLMILQKSRHSKRMHQDQKLILEKNNELHDKNEELGSLLEDLKKADLIIQQQNEQIRKNNAELVQEVKARTNEIVERQGQIAEFAHIVSHDLRGPVARILGLYNILKFSQSEEELSKIIEQLNKSILEIDMVCRDINKVFDAALGVHAKLELVETLPLVDRILKDLEVEIELAGACVTYHIHENANLFFSCFYYVRKNLDELLLNSLKFKNDSRPLEVHIEVQKIESEYHFSVSDNGIGIDLKRFANDVFTPYKRFQTHRTGRGFGLFLLKHRTEILGGRVSIKSEVELSTTVTFTIPEVLHPTIHNL
jgi:signal transduction histidine kinase